MTRGDFQIVTHPEKAPAVDFLLRTGVGPFVDTGVDVLLRSQPGNPVVTERVYLSKSTIQHLAQLVGVAGEGTISKEREQQLIAQGKLEALQEGLDGRLDDVARTLRRWLDDAGIGSPGAAGDSGL